MFHCSFTPFSSYPSSCDNPRFHHTGSSQGGLFISLVMMLQTDILKCIWSVCLSLSVCLSVCNMFQSVSQPASWSARQTVSVTSIHPSIPPSIDLSETLFMLRSRKSQNPPKYISVPITEIAELVDFKFSIPNTEIAEYGCKGTEKCRI